MGVHRSNPRDELDQVPHHSHVAIKGRDDQGRISIRRGLVDK
jgi:hypothetical protein